MREDYVESHNAIPQNQRIRPRYLYCKFKKSCEFQTFNLACIWEDWCNQQTWEFQKVKP